MEHSSFPYHTAFNGNKLEYKLFFMLIQVLPIRLIYRFFMILNIGLVLKKFQIISNPPSNERR